MKRLTLLTAFIATTLWISGAAQELDIDRTRTRKLDQWKPLIQKYSERHYGESTWELNPTCIVLHYTVTKGFPWNLVNTDSFKGETPGLAVHYVIDGKKIWEILRRVKDMHIDVCGNIRHVVAGSFSYLRFFKK